MNRICKQFGYLGAWLILIGASSCSTYDAARSAENQSQPSASKFGHLQLAGNQLDDRSTPLTQPSHSVSSVLGTLAVSDNK